MGKMRDVFEWLIVALLVGTSPVWVPAAVIVSVCAPRRTRERWNREANRMSRPDGD